MLFDVTDVLHDKTGTRSLLKMPWLNCCLAIQLSISSQAQFQAVLSPGCCLNASPE